MEKSTEKSFIKNFFVLGIGTFFYLIVGLIGTPIITRLVNPEDYGALSIFNVYSNIGMMFCGLGLDQSLVRWFYRNDSVDYKRKLLFECCMIPLFLSITVGIFILLIIGSKDTHYIGGYSFLDLTLLQINIIVLLINRYALLILRLRYSTKKYSLINIVQKASYIILTVVLIVTFQKYFFLLLAISTILSTFLATIIAICLERKIWNFRKIKYILNIPYKGLLSYGIPLMFSTGITTLFNALDKLFLNYYCTLSDVGIYTSAMNLMAVFSIVRTSFNALWMPTAIEHYEKKPEDRAFYQQGNAFITLVMVTFGAGVVLCKDIFALILGAKYEKATLIIPFLMFEPIMYTISETTATGIVVQKKSKYQIIVALGAFGVNFIGNWILTPILGPRGAAISTGIAYIVFFALRTILANKVYYVDYEIKKFSLVIGSLFMYACYASTYEFSPINVIMFLFIIILMLFLYRKYMRDIVKFFKKLKKD